MITLYSWRSGFWKSPSAKFWQVGNAPPLLGHCAWLLGRQYFSVLPKAWYPTDYGNKQEIWPRTLRQDKHDLGDRFETVHMPFLRVGPMVETARQLCREEVANDTGLYSRVNNATMAALILLAGMGRPEHQYHFQRYFFNPNFPPAPHIWYSVSPFKNKYFSDPDEVHRFCFYYDTFYRHLAYGQKFNPDGDGVIESTHKAVWPGRAT